MNCIIEARDIKIVKGNREILNIEHFALGKGETVALIGSNGAGKSTFLQVLALLQRPASGKVLFSGDAVSRKNVLQYRRRMAMVFQEPLLLNTNVFNNVAQGLMLRGGGRNEIPSKVYMWLERLGVSHLAKRMPGFLSGGEAQRVSIARAMVLDPEVLFLDEPFKSLDYPTRISLLKDMGEILKSSGVSAIFVTHDYAEIPWLADSAVIMEKGRVSPRRQFSMLLKNGYENGGEGHGVNPGRFDQGL